MNIQVIKNLGTKRSDKAISDGSFQLIADR